MADDSNLIAFSLDDETSTSSNSQPVTSEAIAGKNLGAIDNETERHINAIIANVTRKGLPAPAITLITRYWKPVLAQCASEYGLDSPGWRDSIKKLTHLSLYLDPELKKDYPLVQTKFLPALLLEMRQAITDSKASDHSLNSVVDSIQNKSMTSRLAKTTLTATAITPEHVKPTFVSLTNHSVEDDVGIAEFELDENDSFDFELSPQEPVVSVTKEIEILAIEPPQKPMTENTDLLDNKTTAQSTKMIQSDPADIDELPPLDLEPFKDDN
ncbi:MAG: hypothetical protein RQ783_03085 [Gammaproteobacteria bacterium]|nr:hypothetical protein [Gammaproteobacteria bacterium]